MTWRTDFENAPKGQIQTTELTHHQSGKSYTKKVTMKVPVLLSVGDLVIQSTWSGTRGQWVGLADGQQPDGWQPWPEPMKGE